MFYSNTANVMDVSTLIPKILTANTISEILDISNLDAEFKKARRIIHPDICSHVDAETAFKKLYELNDEWLNGKTYEDESGKYKSNGYVVKFEGDKKLLKLSLENYNKLKAARKKDFHHEYLHKYMPKSMKFNGDVLEVELHARAVPLSELILKYPEVDQKHVNWILSRMLEFAALCNQAGYAHMGINLDSIFIIPKDDDYGHGIQVVSFYHVAAHHTPAKTICGKYKGWYPASLFKDKVPSAMVDMELAKKTAIYLLGDKSGSGVKFRKTHNKPFMDFVIQQHTDIVTAFKQYRDMLSANFEKKFYTLDI